MYELFIWDAVPISYLCCTHVITVSNLLYHIIIFQKLLISPYRTWTCICETVSVHLGIK